MSWNYKYIIIILASTIIDYFASLFMEKTSNIKQRLLFLCLSLCSNLGILFIFKYYNFFIASSNVVLKVMGNPMNLPYINLLLPVGISFYTFQTLSYTIDVFRKRQTAEKNIFVFALYVSFFPQLVAGPIERSQRLLPQFHKQHTFNYNMAKNGLILMAWGLFKKVIIADRVAVFVNAVYNQPYYHTGITFVIATLFFGVQIYCDFSGYSNIAIGAAKILGYDLMTNFRRPFLAVNIKDFWNRWHISLSTWFSDYVYIPLGGNRKGSKRTLINITIVFLLSGFWHGANWTFIIWGALHGFYYIVWSTTKNIRQKLNILLKLNKFPILQRFLGMSLTFCSVMFAWIFFRANTVTHALYIVKSIITPSIPFSVEQMLLGNKIQLIIAIFFILIMGFIHIVQENLKDTIFLEAKPSYIRYIVYCMILVSIIAFGVFDNQQFIYFQF